MNESRTGKPDLKEHKSFVKQGIESLSKDWYDKGADLEGDHAVGAGSPKPRKTVNDPKLPDTLTLLIALAHVPDGEMVTKKTGQKPYKVTREIVIHHEKPENKQVIKASQGAVFLQSEFSNASAESEETRVHWEVARHRLTQILDDQADYDDSK